MLPALHPNDIYYVPEGLPGFEKIKGYSVHCHRAIQPFFYLRALTKERISFTCIDPFLVCPHFDPLMTQSDLAQLELSHPDEAIFVSFVTVSPERSSLTVNLRGPLALNRQRRLAKQIDCGPNHLPLQYPVSRTFRHGSMDVEFSPRLTGDSCDSCIAHPLCIEGAGRNIVQHAFEE